MKLYLEQFNIPCCVLNSELPVATRLHTVSFHSYILFSFYISPCTPFDRDQAACANCEFDFV